MEKLNLPNWAGDDFQSQGDEDLESMIILATKKINDGVKPASKSCESISLPQGCSLMAKKIKFIFSQLP